MNNSIRRWIKRVRCSLGKHEFTRTVMKAVNLEVRECDHCPQLLNINHFEGEAFVSRKHSIYHVFKQDNVVFKLGDNPNESEFMIPLRIKT